jgi:hypothetical protein
VALVIGLRRGPLTTALAVWVGVHVLLAVLTLPDSTAPAATLSAALLGAGTAAAVLLPLRRGGGRMGAPAATAAAAVVPVVAAVDGLLTVPAALSGYALWWMGLLCPVLGGLAVRRRPWHAVGATVAGLGVLAGVMAARWPRPGWVATTVVLATPVLEWGVGGLVVAGLLDRSVRALQVSAGASATARSSSRATREQEARRAARAALLARTAVPLLERVAADGGLDTPELRARAAAVEADLRAELAGRDLLDDAVRAAAAAARARGVEVTVLDHAGAGAEPEGGLAGLRALVACAVDACADGQVTARRPPAGPALTVVHVGTPASLDRVAAAIRATAPPGLAVDVTVDGEALVAEVPVVR